jgi:hypothetical protein
LDLGFDKIAWGFVANIVNNIRVASSRISRIYRSFPFFDNPTSYPQHDESCIQNELFHGEGKQRDRFLSRGHKATCPHTSRMIMGETDGNRETPPPQSAAPPRTPAKRTLAQTVQPDTPQVQRYSTLKNYTNGTLEQRRNALIDGLPDTIPEIPINTFIDHLLPRIRMNAEQLRKLYTKLKDQEIYDPKQRKWPMLGESGKELKDFAKLSCIQNKIAEYAEGVLGHELKCRVVFLSDGSKIPESDWDLFEKARPDGGGRLRENKHRKSSWHWGNIFRADEFKCGDSMDDKDDVSQW